MQALLWVVHARTPLTTTELRHALAVEIGEVDLDSMNMLEIADVLSVCGGLLTVDRQSDVVRLVHYTAQHYFDRRKETWFPEAELQSMALM